MANKLPRQQLINMQAVISYLVMASSMTNGVTVEDISSTTGLGRATVYRIIKKNPAIKRLEMPGRDAKYYLDHEELLRANVARMPERETKDTTVRIPAEPALVQAIRQLSAEEFTKRIREYTKMPLDELDGMTKYDYDRKQLTTVMENSLNFQRNVDSIHPELMAKARMSIDRLKSFGLIWYMYCLAIQEHPNYATDTEWWTIWTED